MLEVGQLLRGYVINANQHGVFIKVARDFVVRAAARELSDGQDRPNYVCGMQVLARIVSFNKDKVNVTLRKSAIMYGTNQITNEDLVVGAKFNCLILSITNKLALVSITGS